MSAAFALLLWLTVAPIGQTFEATRADFATRLVADPFGEREAPPEPSDAGEFALVRYDSPAGPLAAYATPVRDDGRRRPALVWIKGGFGGIGAWLYEFDDAQNDQSVDIYLGSGAFGDKLVVFCPSMRGENDNPGRFEMFLGEVDDLRAALAHVAARPDVDPQRIYVAGHSTGGTLALLLAAASDVPAGVVSIGGSPDFERVVTDGGFGVEPFDTADPREVRLRSPMTYAAMLRVPVLYVEGAEGSNYPPEAQRMQALAQAAGHAMEVAIIDDADHFTVLHAMHRLIAAHLIDGEPGLPTPGRAAAMHREFLRRQAEQRRAALAAAGAEAAQTAYRARPIELTPAAAQAIRQALVEPPAYPQGAAYFFGHDDGSRIDWEIKLVEAPPPGTIVTESHGVTVATDAGTAGLFTGLVLDVDGEGGFFWAEP